MSRIAVLAPSPPREAGIASSFRVVLEQLAKRVDVHVYTNARGEHIRGVRMVRVSARTLRRLDQYDGVIAQFGGSVADDWILEYAQENPTVVVLPGVGRHNPGEEEVAGWAPGVEMAIRTASAVVVHSRVIADELQRLWPEVPLTVAPFPAERADPATMADVYLRATLAPIGRPALQSDLVDRMRAAVDDVARAAGVQPDEMTDALTRAARAIDLLS